MLFNVLLSITTNLLIQIHVLSAKRFNQPRTVKVSLFMVRILGIQAVWLHEPLVTILLIHLMSLIVEATPALIWINSVNSIQFNNYLLSKSNCSSKFNI